MPDLYIITGSNGAGKSTLGAEYLPEHIKSNNIIFDGDLLYTKELSRIFPKIVPSAKYARKEALDYVVQQLSDGKIEYSVEKDELPEWFTTYMPVIAALI